MAEFEGRYDITVRAGVFHRNTFAEAQTARRSISINHCVVIHGGKLANRSYDSTACEVSVNERTDDDKDLWPEEPDKIGAVILDESLFVSAFVPPIAFAEFWRAAEAADGALRRITVDCRPHGSEDSLAVTGIALSEQMSELSFDEKTSTSFVPRRKHPVVAELDRISESLGRQVKSIFIGGVIILVIIGVWNLLATIFGSQ